MKHTTYNVILKEAGVKDRFGRMYPLDELQKLCDHINENTPFGKIGADDAGAAGIELEKVSHSITNAIIKDNKLMVTLKVLPTPQGEILLDKLNNYEERSGNGGLLDRDHVMMNGVGHVDGDGTVKNYSLLSINVKADLES
jgi:hypothetical protein